MKGKRKTLTREGSQSNDNLAMQTQILMKIFQVTIFKVNKHEVTGGSIKKLYYYANVIYNF